MGYEGLRDILRLNAEEFVDALRLEEENPLDCEVDGTPLEAGHDGDPFCRFCGWRPRGLPHL